MQSEEWDTVGDFKVSRGILLGKGQSCEVYYGYNCKNGQKVAAKKIDINKINSKIEKQLENEIKNLRELKSPFIVRLLGYYRHENFYYLFLQYCEDGDLKGYLEKQKKKSGLCEAEALMFMRYIIEGYKELHAHKIIHRDIKPANILLKQGIAKLSDFGFSRVVPNTESSKLFTLLGTPLYTAPEILQSHEFSSKCDVWSVGIVFYEMLYAKTPWTGDNLTDLRDNILSTPLEFGSQIKRKEEIKALIKRMLIINSKQRITWKQIFQNELFKTELPSSIHSNEQEEKSYLEFRKQFEEYVKTNIVKYYLRFDMSNVNFEESIEPMNEKHKIIQKIQKQISHKRNIAFLYAYMLVLFYRNEKNALPKQVNRFMEFQYALAMKAFSTVAKLGTSYFYEDPPGYNKDTWKFFKERPEYKELKKVLLNEHKILQKMCEKIKMQAGRRIKDGRLTKQTIKWFNEIPNDPDKGFRNAMALNHKEIQKFSDKGVCGLLKYYIEYGMNTKAIEQNDLLDFGSFYEKREKEYGLA